MRSTTLALLGLLAAVSAAADERQVLLLIGPPGAGKGTQAEFITRKYGLPSVSTGELLRAEVKAGTELGKSLAPIMAKGELVSDEVVNQLVADRLAKPDAARGIILDGYPRTVPQAKYLDELLAWRGLPKVTVLHIDLPEAEIISRLTARGRADDKPEVIRDRIKVYARDTEPILAHYAGAGYHRIEGTGTPKEVFDRIERVLAPSRR
ncbi:MAG: adenylate kinase [Bryobacteraceae bacterium]